MVTLFDAMPEELTLTWADDELTQQWHAIHHDSDHPRYGEVVAALAAFDAELGAILDDSEAKRIVWRHFFQENYAAVVALERGE